ncbi:MAG: SET domain-containing protein [Planctomycetales bacterium]
MSHPTPRIHVAPCDVGRGLFADEPIAAGRFILEFTGPELTLKQVRAKGALAANALQIGIDRYLDLEEPGRLLNHSCEPNAGVRNGTRLVALRDIQPGEEIRFDYSTTVSDGWTMPCRCGAPHCRGLVVAYQLLAAPLRQRYAILGIVQPFILEGVGS